MSEDTDRLEPETRTFEAEQDARDPLAVLKADHEQARRLAKDYERAGDLLEKVTAAERLCLLLTIHAQLEEEVFYPALRQAGAPADLLNQAVVEHMTVRQLVADVESASAEDVLLDAKVRVLTRYVEEHVAQEEAELFPMALERLDGSVVGARLAARRAELGREAALNLKARLRSSGPASQMSMEHPTTSVQAMPGPIRAASAAADLALAVLPGGGRLRRILKPEQADDSSVPSAPTRF